MESWNHSAYFQHLYIPVFVGTEAPKVIAPSIIPETVDVAILHNWNHMYGPQVSLD